MSATDPCHCGGSGCQCCATPEQRASDVSLIKNWAQSRENPTHELSYERAEGFVRTAKDMGSHETVNDIFKAVIAQELTSNERVRYRLATTKGHSQSHTNPDRIAVERGLG